MGCRLRVCAVVTLIVITMLIVIGALLYSDFFSMRGFGDDTVFAQRDCNFEIVKAVDRDLVFRESPYHAEIVLKKVEKYKKYKGDLYVISDDGYAIVNINKNTCKVFYSNSDISENVNESPDNINTLQSFEEFSTFEKEYFLKLTKQNK